MNKIEMEIPKASSGCEHPFCNEGGECFLASLAINQVNDGMLGSASMLQERVESLIAIVESSECGGGEFFEELSKIINKLE